MLRVTPIRHERATTLKLEGSLSGPWVDVLRKCWAELAEAHTPVDVDLRGLNFLDSSGAALLLDMERSGFRNFGSSAFINDVLYCEKILLNPWPNKLTARGN